MNDYDLAEVFREIELELIQSMKRNLARHQKWEDKDGINWTMWQAEQLKTLEEFKKSNKKMFGKRFNGINAHIEDMLRNNYRNAGFDQERSILEAIQRGYRPLMMPKGIRELLERVKGKNLSDFILKRNLESGISGSFFNLNEGKLNALLKATTKDMSKAEHAILRMSNDQYRKIIFKAQVMADSGASTLKKAIDMASHDFLSAGINCIEYKNGRRVNIATYAEMAVRTANKRAVLVSEGEIRNAYGIHTVRISTYGQCSPTCLPFQGKIFVDDVFSGGTKEEAEKLNLPLLSWAIDQGLFHPNCKHRSTTTFPGMQNEDDGDPRDNSKIVEYENPPLEQEHRKNQLRIQQQKRLETGSLDQYNIDTAKQRKSLWQKKDNLLLNGSGDIPPFANNVAHQIVHNTDDEISLYMDLINIKTNNPKILNLVRNDMKYMPKRDLDLLKKFNMNLEEQLEGVSNYKKTKKRFLSAKSTININKNAKAGTFAHEFAHFAVDKIDLFNNSDFLDVLENSLKGAEIEERMVGGAKFIYVKSSSFVTRYQGRTYIKSEEFDIKRDLLKLSSLKEYPSVGYETYLLNPELLYQKDKRLYDYFEQEGFKNAKTRKNNKTSLE